MHSIARLNGVSIANDILLSVQIAFSYSTVHINPLTDALKPHSNGPLYNKTVTDTLVVDGWAVTFGTARRKLGGLWPRPLPSSLYQM